MRYINLRYLLTYLLTVQQKWQDIGLDRLQADLGGYPIIMIRGNGVPTVFLDHPRDK